MNSSSLPGRSRFSRALIVSVLAVSTVLGGCTMPRVQKIGKGEVATILGPPVRTNRTPMEGVFACYADRLAADPVAGRRPIVIAVGDVKDYTGKYNINEGNAITQGGALMVYSALGKFGGTIGVAERFDPTVAERELGYTDRRQLGDGDIHEIAGPQGGQRVPWVPYYGGTIIKSDYYIVGGITELNYNVNSGGFEVGVNQIGGKARTYNQSVAIDLRIVDTKTLMVVKTVSLTKQFTGYEVGFNIFRFFDSDLFDVNLGAKGQEPLQLGIRTALEEAVVRLVGSVTHVDPTACLSAKPGWQIPQQSAEEMRQIPAPVADLPPPPPPPPSIEPAPVPPSTPPVQPTNGAINATSEGSRPTAESLQIAFEFGSANIAGGALNVLDRAAAMSKVGPVELVVVARDTENYDPGQRDQLTNQRIFAILAALSQRGISSGAVVTTWRPASSDTSIHRDGPGMQEIARLRIGA
jgi:curli biogenesis system outer membrane secretion channel CsgG